MDNSILTFNLGNIFESGKYVIPIYQRNYSWGEPEITQLIQDIFDFSDSGQRESNYYIGTLVVYERTQENEIVFETIDGQQRLTTLNILLNVLHREFGDRILTKIKYKPNLVFDSRKKSTDTLDVISKETSEVQYLSSKEYNSEIKQAYEDTKKVLKKLLNTPERLNSFYFFLTNKVHIMRVSVPEDTDLNHYFEIMNSRGEQLEKHEVLKAKMLETLKDYDDLSFTFNLIWEACAEMEKYVQYGFSTEQRSGIFTDKNWNNLICTNLEQVASIVYTDKKTDYIEQSTLPIIEIVNSTKNFNVTNIKEVDAPDRFSSVINFSNFLLQVLRVQTKQDISLDDKRLIDIFNIELNKYNENLEEKTEFVKLFGFNLLKCKWLFDNYIIKREFTGNLDQWSLKQLKWYEGKNVSYVNTFGLENESEASNKEILMILAMFHVSSPTLVYKHWLNAALLYVFDNTEVSASEYLSYLKNLAKAYLYDRYLAIKESRLDFYDIVYQNQGKPLNIGKSELLDLDLLNQGTDVENFIFNYLDYILWTFKVDKYFEFEFGFRSSVEHYYPQNPIATSEKIEREFYNLFGNLCLISSSKNSRLSNNLPSAKKDYYEKVKPDSLKQNEMMKVITWDIEAIKAETERMTKILLEFN